MFNPNVLQPWASNPFLKQFMEFKAMLDFQCYNVSVASHFLHRFSYHSLQILISFSSNVLRDRMIRSFEYVYFVI